MFDIFPNARARNGPRFRLNGAMSVPFNIETFRYVDLFVFINAYPDPQRFIFESKTEKHEALGDGANKYIYNQLAQNMVGPNEILIYSGDGFFVDINPNSEFWHIDTAKNARIFAFFIGMLYESGSVLPYHLPPALLEMIKNNPTSSDYCGLAQSDMETLLANGDQDFLAQIKSVAEEDFHMLGLDEKTPYDYMWNYFHKNINDITLLIYSVIAETFHTYSNFSKFSIMDIDTFLSGPCEISMDNLKKVITFGKDSDPLHSELFFQVCENLQQTQRKKMLFKFGETLTLTPDKPYLVKVKEMGDKEYDIQVCYRTVDINKHFFSDYFVLKKFIEDLCDENDLISDNEYLARQRNRERGEGPEMNVEMDLNGDPEEMIGNLENIIANASPLERAMIGIIIGGRMNGFGGGFGGMNGFGDFILERRRRHPDQRREHRRNQPDRPVQPADNPMPPLIPIEPLTDNISYTEEIEDDQNIELINHISSEENSEETSTETSSEGPTTQEEDFVEEITVEEDSVEEIVVEENKPDNKTDEI
jgi:hypothetical protein